MGKRGAQRRSVSAIVLESLTARYTADELTAVANHVYNGGGLHIAFLLT